MGSFPDLVTASIHAAVATAAPSPHTAPVQQQTNHVRVRSLQCLWQRETGQSVPSRSIKRQAAMVADHLRLLGGLKRILYAAVNPMHEDQIVEAVKEEVREGKITQSLGDDPTSKVRNCLSNSRNTDKVPPRRRCFEYVGSKTWIMCSAYRQEYPASLQAGESSCKPTCPYAMAAAPLWASGIFSHASHPCQKIGIHSSLSACAPCVLLTRARLRSCSPHVQARRRVRKAPPSGLQRRRTESLRRRRKGSRRRRRAQNLVGRLTIRIHCGRLPSIMP